MRFAIGDVLRQHPIAYRLRRCPRLYMTEPTRLFAVEKFLELVPGESRFIAALERETLELPIYISARSKTGFFFWLSSCNSPSATKTLSTGFASNPQFGQIFV